uniref:DUF155 domain-containing protein n=1 Tax=Arion vulgaris TaxID=1028688 RepID=A0A0B7A1X8_9EUPU
MKRFTDSFSCIHKLLPSHSRLLVGIFSNGNKNKEHFTVSKYSTLTKTSYATKGCFLTSYPRYFSGSRRVEPVASTVHSLEKFFRNLLGLSTSHYMTPLLNSSSAYSTSVAESTIISEASKTLSALQVKRPVRKKLPVESEERKTLQVDSIVAYAVAEEIDTSGLERHLLRQDLYSISKLPQDVKSALHVRGKHNIEQKSKEIFVFDDGCVIFWCVPEVERSAFLRTLVKFSQGTYSSVQMLYEKEEIDFTFSSGKTCLAGDMIQLNDTDRDSQPILLEMYTFSNALAQSVKLAMLESSFNKFVSEIESVTEDLRRGRKISMTRRQVLMKTGELFSLRHALNLSSDLLDTPDFYWDRESLEPLYISLCNYLSISRRTKIMNQKLNHCCELTELLNGQLSDAHHTRLEVMIIILILVEVIFEIVHSVEKYWHKYPTEIQPQLTNAEVIRESGQILSH